MLAFGVLIGSAGGISVFSGLTWCCSESHEFVIWEILSLNSVEIFFTWNIHVAIDGIDIYLFTNEWITFVWNKKSKRLTVLVERNVYDINLHKNKNRMYSIYSYTATSTTEIDWPFSILSISFWLYFFLFRSFNGNVLSIFNISLAGFSDIQMDA